MAGRSGSAAGLKPSAEGKRIAVDDARRTVIDGPFGEARALVAGFSIREVEDMDEAVAWARRRPNPVPGHSEIEIRPFFEAADLADFVTPENSGRPAAEPAKSSASPDSFPKARDRSSMSPGPKTVPRSRTMLFRANGPNTCHQTDDRPEISPDLEGITLLDGSTILLVNDNDFGIWGAPTRFRQVAFAKPLGEA